VDAGEYWIAVAILAVLAVGGFVIGFRWWRWARLIEDTPTSRVRSAAQGYVELIGTARTMPGTPIIAPLSRRPCTWWSFRIERRVSDGKRKRWQTVQRGQSDGLFLLEDDTGRCIVDPEEAEVHESASDRWYGNSPLPEAGPPVHKGFRGFGSGYRYTERRLHDGDPIYAIGWFRTDDGLVGTTIGEEAAHLLRRWKSDQPGMVRRFDRDADGRLSLAEWELAREAAHAEITATRREQRAAPGVHVLEKPRTGEQPLLIAAGTEHDLARRYRWRALGGIAMFLAGTTGLYWLLTNPGVVS